MGFQVEIELGVGLSLGENSLNVGGLLRLSGGGDLLTLLDLGGLWLSTSVDGLSVLKRRKKKIRDAFGQFRFGCDDIFLFLLRFPVDGQKTVVE